MIFHWGRGIFILYGTFVLGILLMVSFYMGQDVQLISKEYYEDEVRYQNKIEKLKRTYALKDKVTFKTADEKVEISFPETIHKKISGEILFFRPSDEKCDFREKLNIDSNCVQTVNFHGKRKGLWKVELSWKAGSEEYLNEKTIRIQ
ncbi:MAG TPA: FixH family protein [Ignavibacteriales bacterium]|nr:FixH family protein [Ignavibacteriales bacterium]